MSEHLIVVFAVGKDRPGRIAEITDALMKIAVYHDDPRTSLLPGGNTSLQIAVRTDCTLEKVRAALDELPGHEEDVVITAYELTDYTTDGQESRSDPRYVLRIRTAGRPGVLAAFTSVIARYDGEVIDFGTRIGGGRISVLRVELPAEADIIEVNRDLYHLAEQIGVGIKFYDAARGEHMPLTGD
ncbi:ACT domain-containing protein [Agilicoccus flavus]|uniref:ACT domain-containing protein n=1 Tax=Agilicoccus flavus TaxID=2775968 RepID=UPI001CF6BFD6|nr:ACT domain-containing protein [Agilicoccus flavus]